jgi:dTMP kinase
MPGKLIVFEGLDGSGITTQATLLRNSLLQSGRSVMLTKEPTDGLIGGIIRACLRKEWKASATTLQLLMTADRSHHLVNEIEPALKSGKTVICDRYTLSTLAYGSLEVDPHFLQQINSKFRRPNVSIIIDAHPRVCIERMKKSRHHVELFEEEAKMTVIRNNYLSLKGYFPNTVVIDGNRSVEEVFRDVKKAVADSAV